VARVEVFIRQAEETAMAQDLGFQRPASLRLSLGVVVILPLSKPHQMHDGRLPSLLEKILYFPYKTFGCFDLRPVPAGLEYYHARVFHRTLVHAGRRYRHNLIISAPDDQGW
jgi:hypothetical protein